MNPSDLIAGVQRCLLRVIFQMPDGGTFEQRLPCVPANNSRVVISGRTFIASNATWHFGEDAFGNATSLVHLPLQSAFRMPVHGESGDL